MGDLYRFGISLEQALIDAFDAHIESRHYKNRSEAIRDLIREELTRKKIDEGGIVAGAVVVTYDHTKRELAGIIMDIQHSFHSLIISTQHVHLDHDNCLEIIAVKGIAAEIEKLSSSIQALVGVIQVSVSISSAGTDPHDDGDGHSHGYEHGHSHDHAHLHVQGLPHSH